MKYTFDTEKFSKAIKTKRVIDLDTGVREAAELIGVSAATVSRCENQALPDIVNYSKICAWLEVSMEKFIKKSKR